MARFSYKKYLQNDHRLLARWAADCADRVYPYFAQVYPQDERPAIAIATCRTWIRTGVFQMAVIRTASLASHAAARDAKDYASACFAARAAGHAAATPHVAQHAYGAAYYALKAIVAADPNSAEVQVAREREWQSQQLAAQLRHEIMRRIVVRTIGPFQ